MRPSTSYWVEKVLRFALIAGALLYIVVYVALALVRSRYPYELEWMEGGTVDHVARVLSGQKLYVEPSMLFTPFIYPPLYFYVSALISAWVGVGFLAPRAVSIVSSVGCLAIIFLFVKRETRSVVWGILAASLFAATYRIGGAWLDLARVDSLFLLLLLAAIYVIRFYDTPRSLVAAGILLSLSFLTKQIALFISLPMLAYCFVTNRRRSIYLIGSLAAVTGIASLVLNHVHGGWFAYYVFSVPSRHDIALKHIFFFWAKEIVMYLSISIIMLLVFLYLQYTRRNRKAFLFYACTIVGMLGGAWMARMHSGSYSNVLLPAYAAIAVLFGIAASSLFALVAEAVPDKRATLRASVYIVCLFQFVALVYDPRECIPTARDRAAGDALVGAIASIPGDVYVPCHTYLSRLAGKKGFVHQMAIWDVMRSGNGPAPKRLDDEIRQAIAEERFNAIILDSESWEYQEQVNRSYAKRREFFHNENVFWPVTGVKWRPNVLYVSRAREGD